MKEKFATTQAELEQAVKDGLIAVVQAGRFTACGSSQVWACGSSQVRAYDSSQVTAYDSSQVTACDSSQVTAYKFVAVSIHGNAVKQLGSLPYEPLAHGNATEQFISGREDPEEWPEDLRVREMPR